MASGGWFGTEQIPHFDGGLFDNRLHSINGEPVRSADEVGAALGKDSGRVEVKVKRGDATHSAVIERR